jgi:hypothetical protein
MFQTNPKALNFTGPSGQYANGISSACEMHAEGDIAKGTSARLSREFFDTVHRHMMADAALVEAVEASVPDLPKAEVDVDDLPKASGCEHKQEQARDKKK